MNCKIFCPYCGVKKIKTFKSRPALPPPCDLCGEKKVHVETISEEKCDIFGYRFDPPFKEDVKLSDPIWRMREETPMYLGTFPFDDDDTPF